MSGKSKPKKLQLVWEGKTGGKEVRLWYQAGIRGGNIRHEGFLEVEVQVKTMGDSLVWIKAHHANCAVILLSLINAGRVQGVTNDGR